jgi:hypothetical protein
MMLSTISRSSISVLKVTVPTAGVSPSGLRICPCRVTVVRAIWDLLCHIMVNQTKAKEVFHVGPCAWEIPFNTCCDCWEETDPATRDAAIEYATTIMWAATGKQFGLCPQTIRPCGRTCREDNFSGYHWSNGVYVPYIFNGVWRNCFCGCHGDRGCPGRLPGRPVSVACR